MSRESISQLKETLSATVIGREYGVGHVLIGLLANSNSTATIIRIMQVVSSYDTLINPYLDLVNLIQERRLLFTKKRSR